jgi:competence protein ComEA
MDRLNEWLNLYKIPLMLSLVGLVLIIGGVFASGLNKPASTSLTSKATTPPKIYQSFEIKIDLSGAVMNPGVYTLSKESRVEDAIKAAGGFSLEADPKFVSKSLNLSQKLADGQKIYIPTKGEVPPTQGVVFGVQAASAQENGSAGANGKVGINSATPAQLDTLPGVGPVTAGKIISGRPYQDVGELLSRKVVTRSVYEKIKDLVDLN